MRVNIIGFLLINFFLCLGCAEVIVEVAHDSEIGKTPKGSIYPEKPPKIPPADQPRSCPATSRQTESIGQDTNYWCWAASAQTIMKFHDDQNRNFDQCDIVNRVYKNGQMSSGGVPFCCKQNPGPHTNPNLAYPISCWKNGWPEYAFNNFGMNWEWSPGFLSENSIRHQLCGVGPIIFILLYDGGGGHSYVVADAEEDNGELILWVIDHSWVTNENGVRSPLEPQRWTYQAYKEGEVNGWKLKHAFDYFDMEFP